MNKVTLAIIVLIIIGVIGTVMYFVSKKSLIITGTGENIENALPSGRYVKLIHTNDKNAVINLSELEIFAKGGKTSIATGQPVTASSLHGSFGSLPELVDGNLANNTHTGGASTEFDFLQVDLGSMHEIEKIKITNRNDCCKERAQGIKVVIYGADGTTVVKETPAITTTADTYTLTFPDVKWL
jgi:hypothetical protein